MIELPPGLGYFGSDPHLSPTSVTQFLRCPEQWRRRHILGERLPPSAGIVRGKADHAAHEANFAQKIYTRADLPVSDVLDAYADKWMHEIDDAGGPSELDGDDDLAKVKDIGAKVVSAYHVAVSPTIQPSEVELPIEKVILEVPIHARIDLVDIDGVPIERKTTGRKKSAPDPAHVFQAQTYAVLLGIDHSELHYAADSGAITTPKESPALLIERREQSTLLVYERTANAIVSMYAVYGPDDPWTGATTHPWACSYCGYRPTCRYWQ